MRSGGEQTDEGRAQESGGLGTRHAWPRTPRPSCRAGRLHLVCAGGRLWQEAGGGKKPPWEQEARRGGGGVGGARRANREPACSKGAPRPAPERWKPRKSLQRPQK